MQLNETEQKQLLIDDRYVVNKELESGGVAKVFVVTDLKNEYQGQLVLKLFCGLNKMPQFDEELSAFMRLRKARHPCLVLPHSFAKRSQNVKINEQLFACYAYIIFPYHPQGDLFTIVTGELSEQLNAKKAFKQLLSTLDYLHNDLDVVHLDIKLENLVMGNDGTVKIIDFGHSQSALEHVNQKRGTQIYQAPEVLQIKSQGPYDGKKADVFALGVVLFAMVFKTMPFL